MGKREADGRKPPDGCMHSCEGCSTEKGCLVLPFLGWTLLGWTPNMPRGTLVSLTVLWGLKRPPGGGEDIYIETSLRSHQ